MNVKIVKVFCRSGWYEYYTGWALEAEDEKGKKVTLMPSYLDVLNFLRDVIIHEFRVDRAIVRNPEERKWRDFFLNKLPILLKETQKKVDEYKIPKIYYPPLTEKGKKILKEKNGYHEEEDK